MTKNLRQIIEENGFLDVAGDPVKSHQQLSERVKENSKNYLRNYLPSDIVFYVEVKDKEPIYLTTYIKRESWKYTPIGRY